MTLSLALSALMLLVSHLQWPVKWNYCYCYYYMRLTASFPGFGVAVASAGPYAHDLHLVPDRELHQPLVTIFTS